MEKGILMKIIAMIPARADSQGLLNKNIKNLCGKPMIQYTIEAALGCEKIDNIVVNSNCSECLSIAGSLGVGIYQRKENLCMAETSMKEVLIDFNDNFSDFDAMIVLYPTFPLRTTEHINKIIAYFEQ